MFPSRRRERVNASIADLTEMALLQASTRKADHLRNRLMPIWRPANVFSLHAADLEILDGITELR